MNEANDFLSGLADAANNAGNAAVKFREAFSKDNAEVAGADRKAADMAGRFDWRVIGLALGGVLGVVLIMKLVFKN